MSRKAGAVYTVSHASCCRRVSNVSGSNAPKFVSDSAAASVGTGTSVVVNAPASIASGNLLVAFVSLFPGATTTQPGGWTEVGSVNNATCGKVDIWTKTAGSSEPSTYTWASSVDDFGVDIRQYNGVTTVDGTLGAIQADSTGSTTTSTWSALTAAGPNEIWVIALQSGGSSNGSLPSGALHTRALTTNLGPQAWGDLAISSAGSTGTLSSALGNRFWATTSILLK